MAVDNATILDKLYLVGSNDYQQRIPLTTQGGIANTIKHLEHPGNGKLFNELLTNFVNLIGLQRIISKRWDNRLNIFKGEKLNYGSMIEEAAPQWLKAHTYDPDSANLLTSDNPEFAVVYHTVNREDKYIVDVTIPEFRKALRDEFGLNKLINAIMQLPINSDNYDEYVCMMQLFAEMNDAYDLFTVGLTAAPTTEETGKDFLTKLRTYAELLTFPTSTYSAGDFNIPVFAKSEELVLLISAEWSASVDVNTLASDFQLDKADIKYRKVVVDQFPIPNVGAVLTTEDFFVVHDYVYQTDSFYNPDQLRTKYFLHHWEVISASPFVPCILFKVGAGTNVPTLTQAVTAFNLSAQADTVEPGGTVQLTGTLNGTLTPSGDYKNIEIAPDSALFTVVAERTTGETGSEVTSAVELNEFTYVDRLGVLHVQKDTLEKNDKLTVTGVSTYINPSGTTTVYSDTVEITIS